MEHGRFGYSAIAKRSKLQLPNGARVAVWVIPNIEHFHYDKPAMSMTPMTMGFKPDVLNYAWRDYGVRVGVWRVMEIMERQGFPGDRCAELGGVPPLSRDHSGGEPARLGVDGAWAYQFDAVHRHARRRRAADHHRRARHDRAAHRQASTRMARARADGDGEHARYPGRSGHRLCRGLVQRRAALSHEDPFAADHRDALYARGRRHSGVSPARRLGRRFLSDDDRPVRHDVRGGCRTSTASWQSRCTRSSSDTRSGRSIWNAHWLTCASATPCGSRRGARSPTGTTTW